MRRILPVQTVEATAKTELKSRSELDMAGTMAVRVQVATLISSLPETVETAAPVVAAEAEAVLATEAAAVMDC